VITRRAASSGREQSVLINTRKCRKCGRRTARASRGKVGGASLNKYFIEHTWWWHWHPATSNQQHP